MKQCTNCGKLIIDEASFCEYCGAPIKLEKKTTPLKRIFIITGFAVLILVSAILVFEFSQLSTQYASLEKEARRMETENQNLNTLLLTSTAVVDEYSSLGQDYLDLSNLVDEKNDEIANLNSELNDSEDRVSYLENITYCDELFNPDYTNNESMSLALINFVAGLGAAPTDGYWETIWDNSSAALHEVISIKDGYQVSDKFVVFFDDDLYSEGVFFINYRCWLDR